MAGQHQADTNGLREQDFAEQAKSITATIDQLQTAIEHHIEHSPHRRETIEACLAEVDRFRQRLRAAYEPKGAPSVSGDAAHGAGELPRVRVGSPRLADPTRAGDFTMEVIEESRDAGL